HGAAEFGGGRGGVAAGERCAQAAERGTDSRAGPAIAGGAFFSLPGALQRRKMICHSGLFLYFLRFAVPGTAARRVVESIILAAEAGWVKPICASKLAERYDIGFWRK